MDKSKNTTSSTSRSSIYRTFLSGLVTVVPIVLTVYLLVWLAILAERMLGGALRVVLPDFLYIPGMGIAVGIVGIYFVGASVNLYIVQSLLQKIEARFNKLPLIKQIYGPIKDVFGFLGQSKSATQGLKRVVLVQLDNPPFKVLGLVTRDNLDELSPDFPKDHVSVLIPMSYALGGYTILVHKDKLSELNIPIDKALTLALTGWMKK